MSLNKIRCKHQKYIDQHIDAEADTMWQEWEFDKEVATAEQVKMSIEEMIIEKEYILNRLN
jgi:hypothetical protein